MSRFLVFKKTERKKETLAFGRMELCDGGWGSEPLKGNGQGMDRMIAGKLIRENHPAADNGEACRRGCIGCQVHVQEGTMHMPGTDLGLSVCGMIYGIMMMGKGLMQEGTGRGAV